MHKCGRTMILRFPFTSSILTKIAQKTCIGMRFCYAYYEAELKKNARAHKESVRECVLNGTVVLRAVVPAGCSFFVRLPSFGGLITSTHLQARQTSIRLRDSRPNSFFDNLLKIISRTGMMGLSATCVLLLTATAALSETQLLERKPYLSKYQDAWKSLKVPGKYYLYMRSYEDEPLYGANRKCVFSELVSVNEEEKYTINVFGSIDLKDGLTKTHNVYAFVRASEGYSVPNVIEAAESKEKLFTIDYPVAFSEYDNCDILRVPHRNNGES
ncbi:hypothetical protein V5799_024120 [Amblyomma americanum]|uniref:Salivary lipocalin n=1 Tax=Amblyomma americanum TaxID=6943 RepID=A0AAQ4EDF2_AMBAM